MATAATPDQDRPVEACLAELLDHLGIASAHFAGRGTADLQGFASRHAERMASLTLLCPAVLDTRTLAPLAARLLVVTGDHGPGAQRARAGLRDLPHAVAVVLGDYAGLTWSDLAAERGDSIGAAMQEFLMRLDALPAVGLPDQEGEIAGISFRLRGAGTAAGAAAARSFAGAMGATDPDAVRALLHDHSRRRAARQRCHPRGARAFRLHRRRARVARRAGDRAGRERARSRLRLGRDHARTGAAHRAAPIV